MSDIPDQVFILISHFFPLKKLQKLLFLAKTLFSYSKLHPLLHHK